MDVFNVSGFGFRVSGWLRVLLLQLETNPKPETRHADGYAHLTDCEAINPKQLNYHEPYLSSNSKSQTDG